MDRLDGDIITADAHMGKALRMFLFLFFAIMIITFAIFLPTYMYFLFTRSQDALMVVKNPIMGVFVSFFLSTFIVLFLKYSSGPIEFEGLTFQFRGASGPVVLWALCFLVIIIGFWTLGGSQ